MGDFFERIVDVEVTSEEAEPLAERMVGWMVTEGLTMREMSSAGVDSMAVGEGYKPGPNWQRAVADPSASWIGVASKAGSPRRPAGSRPQAPLRPSTCEQAAQW